MDKSVGSGLTKFDKRFSNSKTIMNRIKINIYIESQRTFMNSALRTQFLTVFTRSL